MTTDNFDKIGKENNILDRVEQAERKVRSTTRKNVSSARLSNLSSEMGEVEYRAKDTDGKLRMVMSAYDLFDELGVHAHFVGLDSSGVVQFYLSADDGKVYAAGGDITIDFTGIWVENQAAAIGFKDTSGNRSNLYLYSDSLDSIGIINDLASKAIIFTIKTTDGSTPVLKWREDPANANVPQLNVSKGTGGGKFSIDSSVVIWAAKDGTETVFNDDSFDVDHRWEGATDTKLLYLDGGLDAAAFGGDPESGTKLKVHGNVNLSNGSVFKIDGTTVLTETTRPTLFYPTHVLSNTVPASTTHYACPFVSGATGATQHTMVATKTGDAKNLYVRLISAQPASGSLVVHVRLAASTNIITVTIPAGSAGSTTYSNLVTTAAIAAGNSLGFQIVNNATAASAQIGFIGFEIECDP